MCEFYEADIKRPEMASDATLRDYFAAKAMAAIVRRWDGHSFGGGHNSPQYKENQHKEPPMIYAIAGGARMGAFQLNESLLERITRKLRDGWKRLIDVLNQPGVPKNG